MKIEDAIKLVLQEYEKAKGLEYVRDPIAYALYHAWKEADRAGRARPRNKQPSVQMDREE